MCPSTHDSSQIPILGFLPTRARAQSNLPSSQNVHGQPAALVLRFSLMPACAAKAVLGKRTQQQVRGMHARHACALSMLLAYSGKMNTIIDGCSWDRASVEVTT